MSDGDAKFGAVGNDKIEAGAVTPIYEDPAKQDTIRVHRTRVLILHLQQIRTWTLM